MSMALEGIKIIDLSRQAPGPYCTMILANLGADVIKVEEPRTMEPDSPYNALNRNKRSIGLNLKHPDSVEHRDIPISIQKNITEIASNCSAYLVPQSHAGG